MIIVANINPPITSTLNFTQPLEANGIGACNTFEGSYTLQGPMEIAVAGFTYTTESCTNQSHTDFEISYFGYLQDDTLFYSITQTADGYELRLSNFIFGVATFTDYILPSPEHELNRIRIYPNPVTNRVHISPSTTLLESVSIFNISGQLLYETSAVPESISVSHLNAGLYFITITSETGSITKKFIKE